MRPLALLPLSLLLGCSAEDRQEAAGASNAMSEDVSSDVAAEPRGDLTDDAIRLPADEQLIGRWVGPEGLYADLQPLGGGRYTIAMQYTLDQKGVFKAARIGDNLVLERPDGRISLSYGAGAETGMKWVAPGAHCLIARLGEEAYCRTAPVEAATGG